MTYRHIRVETLSPHLGAEIGGVDVSAPVADEVLAEIRDAFGRYRRFDNRRQVAAYAGLAPTPWQSGSIDHEQGVSKSGNPRLRTTMVELA